MGRRRSAAQWAVVIAILLLAWGLRLCCLTSVPPGWRDDELINIHALSGELLQGRFPLYFTGASGHEPLYHYLHAGVHAVLGSNPLSAHVLSVAFGTLAIALTYALVWRFFGPVAAALASLMQSVSFWSLMYSRTAIRHISLPPFALAVLLLIPVSLDTEQVPRSHTASPSRATRWVNRAAVRWVLVGLTIGVSLYTYPAARLLPALLVLFAIYLALFHRDRFHRHWRGLLLALVLAALLAVPLGIAIARGRSAAAGQGIGADARIAELAVPLRELQDGNPRPLLDNVWRTLGMFHATGDEEVLYNISGRPVFNLLGGVLLWAGVGLCIYHWRRPRYVLLLLLLLLGLLPAFLSVPAASLSHTILVMPLAYVLPVLPLVEARRRLARRLSVPPDLQSAKCHSRFATCHLPSAICYLLFAACYLLFSAFLVTTAVRDVRDYFVVWPRDSLVRILYRADYREASRYLNARPDITDIAVASTLFGPWDRLAMELDTGRDDVAVRLFDPRRALVWCGEDAVSRVLLTTWPPPDPHIDRFLRAAGDPAQSVSPHLTLVALPAVSGMQPADAAPAARFANGLQLVDARWSADPPAPGEEAVLLVSWRVTAPLDLPPMPIVANPPPPGVYSGPRLRAFTHLLAGEGVPVAVDDGLWVDPLTLQPGDRFVQVHRFAVPAEVLPGPYTLELGLYDPKTGDRWRVVDAAGQLGADRVLIPVPAESAF